MKKKKKFRFTSDGLFDLFNYAFLLILLLIIAYPLYYVLIASISDPYEVYAGKTFLLPSKVTFEGYARVFKEKSIATGYLNSIYYTVLGTVVSVALIITTGYCVSKKTLPFRRSIMLFYVFTMYFNGGLIPTYLVVSDLHLLNSMWSIVLPNAVGVTNFIIMKNSFENSIPDELKEAASVEGCSDIGIFLKIVLPLSKPILAVMVIFYSVGHWNEYFNALLYITEKSAQPLQVVLRDILISNELTEMMGNVNQLNSESRLAIAEGMKYSTIVISSLPMILLYPFFQKYFVKGVMVGAVKG